MFISSNKPIELENKIIDFESCVLAGNPVMESYPRQCRSNEKTFVEIIEKSNQIQIYFREQIMKRGIESLGRIPIEGFNPELYKKAFPKIRDIDFEDTESIGGVWKIINEEI